MRRGRGAPWSAVVLTGLWLAAAVPLRAQEIRDWPCDLALAERFVAEDVWGGRLPGPLPDDWRADPRVRDVVAFAANPENPPAQGAAEIRALAERLGGDRQPALLGLFGGLLEEFDAQRGFVIEGVRDFVVRAKIIREAVDENEAALAALPEDAGAEVEEWRQGYREARFWDARNLDDALDEARFLCRRYAYLDQKLRRLTAAIQAAQ